MLAKRGILGALIIIYLFIFSAVNQSFQNKPKYLQMGVPAPLQKILTGYLSQLASEMLFIKTIVFLGELKPDTPEDTYSAALSSNFETMTSLYPEFIDPYYFAQSFLAPISEKDAQATNDILEKGIKTYPDELIFRFFYAFNLNHYLDDPIKAADAFLEASKIKDAPPVFKYLATTLSGKGGNIQAKLVMLKQMLEMEQDEKRRALYNRAIKRFKKALIVEKAILLYRQKHGVPPETLEDLIPDFLNQMPEIPDNYTLSYKQSVLKLERP